MKNYEVVRRIIASWVKRPDLCGRFIEKPETYLSRRRIAIKGISVLRQPRATLELSEFKSLKKAAEMFKVKPGGTVAHVDVGSHCDVG